MNKRVIIILGPTAVGKSEVAIELAKNIDGEIISADSMQIYKELNVGTAKTTLEERKNIPHYLIDIRNMQESYNVWHFKNDSLKLITDIQSRNKNPIIVGGTNLYIKALVDDYSFEDVEGRDPPLNIKNDFDYHLYALNLPREVLYDRINKRVDIMLNKGLLDEVKYLKSLGLTTESQAGKSIGYQELLNYLDGKISYDEAVDKIKQHSRNYAKRQITWLRSTKNLTVLDADNLQVALEKILKNEKL